MRATRRTWRMIEGSALGLMLLTGPAGACQPDATQAGSVCIDKYEASAWEVPASSPSGRSNRELISRIQDGTATLAALTAGGAMQKGMSSGDYPCADDGQDCVGRVYALSIPGVMPSAYITWFQAQQACANSRKRLPSNADWQMAVAGTPAGGAGDDGTSDCNTDSTFASVPTGSRRHCVSAWGAYDMVGNVDEWVADWVPQSTTCGSWSGRADYQCVAGAATTGEPGALIRGGDFSDAAAAGPLAVSAVDPPSFSYFSGGSVGFRCAR
jgi:formylglycine-generating enzyme required for sulfatase activity